MTEFEINTGGGYTLRFHSKEKLNGLDYYSVTLKAPNSQATIRVYDHPAADCICAFFKQLSQNWKGLEGTLNCHSMEGEFELSATSDSTGHTYLTAIGYSNTSHEPPFSELRIDYIIEAGQLAKFVSDSQKFFD